MKALSLLYHFTPAFISDVKIGGGGAVWFYIFGGVKLVLDFVLSFSGGD